jgi:hypothetical protein
MGRFRQFIVEYVGNHHYFVRADRRSDRRARELMDWVKRQMEARRFEAARKREVVHNLRQVLRPGDASGVGGRDAPS